MPSTTEDDVYSVEDNSNNKKQFNFFFRLFQLQNPQNQLKTYVNLHRLISSGAGTQSNCEKCSIYDLIKKNGRIHSVYSQKGFGGGLPHSKETRENTEETEGN